MSNHTVIELADVDIVHEDSPDVVLIRNVRWRVAEDEFWVIGGDRSSGKSSLLATAAGLSRPAAGGLRIFGRDLAQATEAEQMIWRRRMGFIFEYGGRLLSHLTVAGNIALPLEYHLDLDEQTLQKRVAELLTLMELQEHADCPPSRLSPGLQQRAALARALAIPTEVLFLDNPLSGHGPREARWWLDMLRDLRAQHKSQNKPLTILAASNDFHGWIDLASHFAIIQDAQFRVIGTRDKLDASQEPGLRDLLAAI